MADSPPPADWGRYLAEPGTTLDERMERALRLAGLHATLEENERQLHKNIRQLLTNVAGAPVSCRGTTCEVEVWWVQHVNRKRAPYTEAGLNHFIDCVNADEFRRAR